MTAKISIEDILIRVQETPNPYALKFIINQNLSGDAKITFHDPIECESVRLASDIFGIPGLKQVYMHQNTLTVTHDGSLDNETLREQVKSILKTRIPAHDPEFAKNLSPKSENRNSQKDRSELPPERQQIEEILDRTIRPGLQADGGDVEVLEFENNILKILYQGACGGCPSSMMGTLDAIQGILRHEMNNEEIRVTPV